MFPTVGRTAYRLYEKVDQSFTDWLYGEYSKGKLNQFEFFHHGPLGDYMDYKLDIRADEEYLHRYGMTYGDIHDPRKLKQVNSGSRLYGAGFNFVSKNIGRLYR